MSHSQQVLFLTAAVRPDQFPPGRLPEVAVVGRSNVGKSSLINALVGRKGLARTSQTPGKTQLIHFYQVEERFLLVDLPGYGFARVPETIRKRWRPMVEGYLTVRDSLRLVVFLLDIRRVPNEGDLQLRGWLSDRGIPTCFVATKADKLSRGARFAQARQIALTLGIAAEEILLFSVLEREGQRTLWARIAGAVKA
jgi:GTP-binding protein